MKAYIDVDEILVTATILEAAGKVVTITAQPGARYPSLTAWFNEAGELMSDDWPIGVLLCCGSERVFNRGSRGSIVDALYRFAFDDAALNFTVRLPGRGGGVVDVNVLEHYEGEEAYAFPVASISFMSENVFTEPDQEIIYEGLTMSEIRQIIADEVAAQVTELADLKAQMLSLEQRIEEVARFAQDIVDSIDGPDATIASVREAFWRLSDVITALMEAAGIELPQPNP